MSCFRQCVSVNFDLAVAGQNNQNVPPFNLNFPPDEVIVRQVVYVDNAADYNVFNVITNMTEQPVLCSVQGDLSQAVAVENHFSLRNYSNRSYNFQVVNSTTGAPIVFGIISVLLEFVQHNKNPV